MNLFNFFKKSSEEVEQRNLVNTCLTYNSRTTYQQNKSMCLSAVYRCVEVISDNLAKLPIELFKVDVSGFKSDYKQHPTQSCLENPNSVMSRYTFIKMLVTSMLLQGNGYAYIKRDNLGNAVKLFYLPPEYVTIIPPKHFADDIMYSVIGVKGLVESCNIIHIVNYTENGYTGISTLRHARNILGIAAETDKNALDFFTGGGNLSGLLTTKERRTKEQKQQIKNEWYESTTNQPLNNSKGIVVLDSEWDFTPITVNPKDAQMLDNRKFNVIEICRFFNVNPVLCYDLEHSSYSTIEAVQLDFYNQTLSPIIAKFEQEFKRKLFATGEQNSVEIHFNTTELLRTDKSSLASYYNTLFNIGVMSPNDIRKELDYNAVEGGDTYFVQTNLMPVERAKMNTPTDNRVITEEEKGGVDEDL